MPASRTPGSPAVCQPSTIKPDPQHDQDLFVAALEKVAIETAADNAACPATCLASTCETTITQPGTTRDTDELIVEHLYKMADADEAAGNFDRSDQWRAHAREIRNPSAPVSPVSFHP